MEWSECKSELVHVDSERDFYTVKVTLAARDESGRVLSSVDCFGGSDCPTEAEREALEGAEERWGKVESSEDPVVNVFVSTEPFAGDLSKERIDALVGQLGKNRFSRKSSIPFGKPGGLGFGPDNPEGHDKETRDAVVATYEEMDRIDERRAQRMDQRSEKEPKDTPLSPPHVDPKEEQSASFSFAGVPVKPLPGMPSNAFAFIERSSSSHFSVDPSTPDYNRTIYDPPYGVDNRQHLPTDEDDEDSDEQG